MQPRSGPRITWPQIITHWALIEADLHQVYGIDLEDAALLRARSWRWLRVRVIGLLSTRSRLHHVLTKKDG